MLGLFEREWEVSFESDQEIRGRSYAFLCRPGGSALGDQSNIEFALVVIRRGLDQAAYFFLPVRIALSQAIGEHFDPDDPLACAGAEKRAGTEEKRAKDEASYPSARNHR